MGVVRWLESLQSLSDSLLGAALDVNPPLLKPLETLDALELSPLEVLELSTGCPTMKNDGTGRLTDLGGIVTECG